MSKYALTEGEIETMHCPKCGMLICLPTGFAWVKRKDGGDFFCPAGHPATFGKGETQRLQEKADALLNRAVAAENAKYNAERRAKSLARKLKKVLPK